MNTGKWSVFALLLLGGVGVAVVGLVAQGPATPPAQIERRLFTLDGRGGHLGVMVEDLDGKSLEAAGVASGVRIGDVDQQGPAARAGLRDGDIVVEVDGERVRGARQFARVIQETPDGRAVTLAIVRDGTRQTVNVTPESRADAFAFDGDRIGRDVERSLRLVEPRLRELEPMLRGIEPRMKEFHFDAPLRFDLDLAPELGSPRGRLGVQVRELTPQLAEFFGVTDGGVLVASITENSAAAKAGLKAGDVIVSVNGDRVREADDLVDELRDTPGGEIALGIVRDKKESTVTATIESTPRPARRRPA